MSDLIIKISADEATVNTALSEFAKYHGWSDQSVQTKEQLIGVKLWEHILDAVQAQSFASNLETLKQSVDAKVLDIYGKTAVTVQSIK